MILTWDFYERITGDTSVTDPDVFASAASAAQDLLEDELGRIGMLELGERTESLPPSAGFVYPTAVPIVSATDWTIRDDSLYAGPGTSIDVGVWLGLTDYADDCVPFYIDVTYVGGFDSDTAPAYMRRDLALATFAILHPPDLSTSSAVPAGATSVRVGDVAVTYEAGEESGGSAYLLPEITWSDQTLRHKRVTP